MLRPHALQRLLLAVSASTALGAAGCGDSTDPPTTDTGSGDDGGTDTAVTGTASASAGSASGTATAGSASGGTASGGTASGSGGTAGVVPEGADGEPAVDADEQAATRGAGGGGARR